jgi:hypothetical protein
MGVRHGVGALHDAGKLGDIGRLLVDLIVHGADEFLIRINDGWHPHAADRLNPPCGLV